MGRDRWVERAICDNCGARYENVAPGGQCSDCDFAGTIRENRQLDFEMDEMEVGR